MKPHKWAKEIKHWADGGEIENYCESSNTWEILYHPRWYDNEKYRIKPQPKEPQYLYVIMFDGNINQVRLSQYARLYENEFIFGKIKLEVNDD